MGKMCTMLNRSDEYITVADAAAMCGVPEGTMRSWRARHVGPPSYKFVGVVKYRREEVVAWIERQRDAGGDRALELA